MMKAMFLVMTLVDLTMGTHMSTMLCEECQEIMVSSTGGAAEHHPAKMGLLVLIIN